MCLCVCVGGGGGGRKKLSIIRQWNIEENSRYEIQSGQIEDAKTQLVVHCTRALSRVVDSAFFILTFVIVTGPDRVEMKEMFVAAQAFSLTLTLIVRNRKK